MYQYHAGPVSKVGNVYPREYSRLFYEGQKDMGQQDIVNLVRCAWVGSGNAQVPLVWSGDIWSSYEDFRKQFFGAFLTTHYVSLGSLLVYAGFMIQMVVCGQMGLFGAMPQSQLYEMYAITAFLTVMAPVRNSSRSL